MQHRHFIPALLLPVLLLTGNQGAQGVTTADFRHYSTINSIGMEWDLTDDENHNAASEVQYRQSGTTTWETGLPLSRVDFNGSNMLAGSLFFLEPGTTYEISLHLTDPDGGSVEKTVNATTRSVPSIPAGGRTFYVNPGDGGGTGTIANPFGGIVTAQQNASPGDVFLLADGIYSGEIELRVSGTAKQPIVWKAGGNQAILETVRINADFIQLEGFRIQGNQYGVRTYNDPQGVVITNNVFTGCHYCIYLNHGGTDWYIADNTIVGDVAPASGSFSGEGIELNHSNGHVVAHNSITRVADGVSYPGTNCDIYGNEIFDVSDDGIEPDYGRANNRIWGNRISNALHNGISLQPMEGAPWYILRNQVAAPIESALKFRDRIGHVLLAHNTFIGWKGAQKSGSSHLLAVQSNNNLWISMTDWYIWENSSGGVADWRTNLDYDGFDWGNHVYGFKWQERYSDLASFSDATGLERHGIRINKDTCLNGLNIPDSPPSPMPLQFITLKPNCNAVDAGIPLANINDSYTGTAPDLGVYEVGVTLPHYGPRNQAAPVILPPGFAPQGSIVPILLPILFN